MSYYVSLVNMQGYYFDHGNCINLKSAVKWSLGRGNNYIIEIREAPSDPHPIHTYYTANGKTIQENGKRVYLKDIK